MNKTPTKTTRLDKYCAHQGIASRREVKKLVEKKLVLINNNVAESAGQSVSPTDIVTLKPHAQAVLARKESVIVFKPRGVISAKQGDGNKTVFKAFPKYNHLHTVGRLDKESEGLLLLSNDGVLAKAITGSHHPIEKEYIVKTREPITPAIIKRLSGNIQIDGIIYKSQHAEKVSKHEFSITLKQGKKHHIRRMANACRLTIKSLTRTRIGHLNNAKLKLAPGESYRLTKEDREIFVKQSQESLK